MTTSPRHRTVDANEAVADVAYRASEVIAIYPITPASVMGEHADAWSADRRPNVFGAIPTVTEMQSEGGAAGAIHGALQAGALATTFTASQGLLLMLPNLFKIAGELTSFCMHVAARTVATHALSIFGDHSDVMAARGTGMALLCSGSAQEAQDLAAIGHAATLRGRIPVLHFFDGFRTSHEITKVLPLEDEALRALLGEDAVRSHRARALDPDHPVVRGTSQNPDAYFQSREAVEPFYAGFPAVVHETMERFAELTGRRYRPFDYVGHPEADRVVVLMGSGAECAHETVERLLDDGERVGVVKVRLFRPFSVDHFLAALPPSALAVTVLDRTKEPGASGEPLFQEVTSALVEAGARGTLPSLPRLLGGRYGLASKEFSPAMVKAVFDNMKAEQPKRHFTVGIRDDVSGSSLAVDSSFDPEPDDVSRALFFGLGADGTVSANKATIKIIGEETSLFAQGYFEYDSRKAGSTTTSHLRFGPRVIRSTYRIRRAQFIAVHDPGFLERRDVLSAAMEGTTVLLNTPLPPERVWASLPLEVQGQLVRSRCRLFVIDGYGVAEHAGLGRRINTVMQACFFALSKVLPLEQAMMFVRRSIEETWGRRGPGDRQAQHECGRIRARRAARDSGTHGGLDRAPASSHGAGAGARVRSASDEASDGRPRRRSTRERLPARRHLAHRDESVREARPRPGDPDLATRRLRPVQLLFDGLPAYGNPDQGLRPRAARTGPGEFPFGPRDVRVVVERASVLRSGRARGLHGLRALHRGLPGEGPAATAPQGARLGAARGEPRRGAGGLRILPDAPVCAARGARAINKRTAALRAAAVRVLGGVRRLWRDAVPASPHPALRRSSPDRQCHGLLVDLRRESADDSVHQESRRPRPGVVQLALRRQCRVRSRYAPRAGRRAPSARTRCLGSMAGRLGAALVEALLDVGANDSWLDAQRERVARARRDPRTRRLSRGPGASRAGAPPSCRRAVWIVGGDGWAYDIGYGGLDHVLASGKNVNVLVLDTEVYSNTGGQQSKATPLGAAAKFATAGKSTRKKDLGLLAMSYGHVYVAEVAMQSRSAQTVEAFLEAERHPGLPSSSPTAPASLTATTSFIRRHSRSGQSTAACGRSIGSIRDRIDRR